jgi:streptogramin lyase
MLSQLARRWIVLVYALLMLALTLALLSGCGSTPVKALSVCAPVGDGPRHQMREVGQPLGPTPSGAASSGPHHITLGPDGNLWFTETNGNRIGRINPTTGRITEFPIPTSYSYPWGITLGPDGNLWFTEGGNGQLAQLGRIDMKTLHIDEVRLRAVAPSAVDIDHSQPLGIVTGPDKALWFTEDNSARYGHVGRIGRFDLVTGVLTEFPLDSGTSLYALGAWDSTTSRDITAGPGGVWFSARTIDFNNVDYHTNVLADFIGMITPNGVITRFNAALTGVGGGFPYPLGITAAPDGNLWFAEGGADFVGRMSPTGVVNHYHLKWGAFTRTREITVGPDNNLWFTEWGDLSGGGNGDTIGRLTLTGVLTDFPLPTINGAPSNGRPEGITAGPQCTVWFTEFNNDRIGNIT